LTVFCPMARGALLCIPLFLLCLAILASHADAARKMVGVYELKNKKGDFSIKVTNWGATIMSVIVPDSKGNLADVEPSSAFGTVVGRVANRIANGTFVPDGKTIRLNKDGTTVLHGGHRVIWTAKEYVAGGDSPYVTLYYHSFLTGSKGSRGTWTSAQPVRAERADERDGAEQGDAGEPGEPRVLEPANLGSHGSAATCWARCSRRGTRPWTGPLIPTGEVAPVSGTPYDLRAPLRLGSCVGLVSGAGMAGFDINYAVDGQYGAVCVETRDYPDAVNHPNFPSEIVRPGGVAYKHDIHVSS
ncbi:LOW QUALITY PROTEIN: hypothetical protein U9M48_032797, partial [Paspalum notatum var. saurae]